MVAVLILLGSTLAPLAIVATWVDGLVSDTDVYVETVEPLARNPAVQAAIAHRVTTTLLGQLDIEAVTRSTLGALADRGLPRRAAATLNALVGPVAESLRAFVEDEVRQFVRSVQFERAWVEANREAHRELVAVLTGDSGNSRTFDGDSVTIGLDAVLTVISDRLHEAGFTLVDRMPDVHAEFTLLTSAEVGRLQHGFQVLSTVSTLFPLLTLLCFAGAVGVARSRRRALAAAAVGLAAGMLLLGIALNTFRVQYLDALPSGASVPAAGAVYDALTSDLRLALRGLLVLTLVAFLVVWAAGPARTTVGLVRRAGEVAWPYRAHVRALVLGAIVVAYVSADHPTTAWTLGVVGVGAAVLVVAALIARPPVPAGRMAGGRDAPDQH